MKPERTNEANAVQAANSYNGGVQRDPAQRAESFTPGGVRPAQPEYPERPSYRPAPPAPDFGRENGGGNVTVISQGTVIVGDVKSDSDIEMLGTVTGGISTTGNVKINGKQNGDVQGSSVTLSACTVRGNLSASDDITVDGDSVIVGDIKCGNLTFDGKLKGSVHVMGNVNCQGNAIIIGDIASTTITVDSGAKLQGKVQVSDGSVEQVDLPADFADAEKPAK